jgi:mono/diheme cytochrome c family protein
MKAIRTTVWFVVVSLAAALNLVPSIASAQPGQRQMPGWDMWDPGWMHRPMWDPGHMGPMQQQRMLRHWTFMHQGVPAEHRGQTSIIAPTDAPVQEGGRLYAENCASCHGSTGLGDGEAGRALNPSPALLAYMINMPMAVDEYLLWTISEGGKPLGTDMPAFKDSLTKEEIWKVIAFMRTGFPSGTGQN